VCRHRTGAAVGWRAHMQCTPLYVVLTTVEHSAVVSAGLRSTICHSHIPLLGLRQRRRLAVPLQLERLRDFRRRLEKVCSARWRLHTFGVHVRPCGRPRPREVPQVDLTLSDRKCQPLSDRKCQICATYTCHESVSATFYTLPIPKAKPHSAQNPETKCTVL
jgi:hypothetical protein